MARRLRIESAGFHHVYNRGVEKRKTFMDDKDKDKFLEIVCEVAKLYHFKIHSYCLMDNHYHLLLENEEENLSLGMRQINSSYAKYFNKRYIRVGHLWQGRLRAYADGHTQTDIGKFIGISNVMVSKIIKRLRVKA